MLEEQVVTRKVPQPGKTVFSASEACGYMGLCWNSLKKLANNGDIRFKRVGKRYLFTKEALDEFLNEESIITKAIIRGLK
jgi:excisionase family DNA binding protein